MRTLCKYVSTKMQKGRASWPVDKDGCLNQNPRKAAKAAGETTHPFGRALVFVYQEPSRTITISDNFVASVILSTLRSFMMHSGQTGLYRYWSPGEACGGAGCPSATHGNHAEHISMCSHGGTHSAAVDVAWRSHSLLHSNYGEGPMPEEVWRAVTHWTLCWS